MCGRILWTNLHELRNGKFLLCLVWFGSFIIKIYKMLRWFNFGRLSLFKEQMEKIRKEFNIRLMWVCAYVHKKVLFILFNVSVFVIPRRILLCCVTSTASQRPILTHVRARKNHIEKKGTTKYICIMIWKLKEEREWEKKVKIVY